MMDPISGEIKEVAPESVRKEGKVYFIMGETIEVKGCAFSVVGIDPEENILILLGIPLPGGEGALKDNQELIKNMDDLVEGIASEIDKPELASEPEVDQDDEPKKIEEDNLNGEASDKEVSDKE